MLRRLALCLALVWVVAGTPTPTYPTESQCISNTVTVQSVVYDCPRCQPRHAVVSSYLDNLNDISYYGFIVAVDNTLVDGTATVTAYGNTSIGTAILGEITDITVPSVMDGGLVLLSAADLTSYLIGYGVPPGGPIITSVNTAGRFFTQITRDNPNPSSYDLGYILSVEFLNAFSELCRLASSNFTAIVNATTNDFLNEMDERFLAYESELQGNGALDRCPCDDCVGATYSWAFLSLTGASLGAVPVLSAYDALDPTAPYYELSDPTGYSTAFSLFNLPQDLYTAVFSVQVGDYSGGETVIFSLEFYASSPVPINSYPIHPPKVDFVYFEEHDVYSAPPGNQIYGFAHFTFVEKIPNIAVFIENTTVTFFGVDPTLPSHVQPHLGDCQDIFQNSTAVKFFDVNMFIQLDPANLASVQSSMYVDESIFCTFRLAFETTFEILDHPAAAYSLFNMTVWGTKPLPLPQPPLGDLGIMGYYNYSAINVNPTIGEWVFGGYLVLTGVDTQDYICAPGPGLMNYNSTSFNGTLFDPSYFFTPLCTTSAINVTMPSDRLVPQLSVACDAGIVLNPSVLLSSLYGPCVNTSNGNSIEYIIQFGVWDVNGLNTSAIGSSFQCTVTANQTTAGFGITNTTFVFKMPPILSAPYIDPNLFGRLLPSAPSTILQTDGTFIPVKRSTTKRAPAPPVTYACDQTEVLAVSVIDLAATLTQSLEGTTPSRRRSVSMSNSTILLIGSLSLIADSIIENINNQTALAIIIANQTGISIDNATLIATQLYNFYVIVVNNEPTPAPTIPPTTPPPTAEPFTTSKGWYIWGLTAIPLTGFLAALVGGMVVYLGLQGSAQKAKGFKSF